MVQDDVLLAFVELLTNHGGQIVAGSLNGLGSLEYEIVTADPVADQSLWQWPDRRTLREKFGRIYAKDNPFPRERHGGQGYKRKALVDLEKVTQSATE